MKNSNSDSGKNRRIVQRCGENAYRLAELQRPFGFEFCGMRNHEYYFRSLEGGTKSLDEKSSLKKAIEDTWGSFDNWLAKFNSIALTRGIGWAVSILRPADKNSA